MLALSPSAAPRPSDSLYRIFFLSSCLLLAALQPAAASPNDWNVLTTSNPNATLHYYVHVRIGHLNLATLLPALNPDLTSGFGFAQLFAFNVTLGSDPQSTHLGFVRGYTIQASYDGTPMAVEVAAVSYDDGSLSGTIQLQGVVTNATNELAVVGGTGHFRGVRGHGIISQVSSSSDGQTVLYQHHLHFY